MIDDIVGGLLEALLENGLPNPVAIRHQRLARLASAIGAAAVLLGLEVVGAAGPWWMLGVAVSAFVAAWVLAFSLVDLCKEFPPVSWVSVIASAVGAAVVGSSLRLLFLRLGAA